jgi:hypothetical protein
MRLAVGRLIAVMCVNGVGVLSIWRPADIQALTSRAQVAAPPQRINLAERLATGGHSVGKREVAQIKDRAGAIVRGRVQRPQRDLAGRHRLRRGDA